METTRDFTATTIIVHRDTVLLHRHRNLGIWIPVGGHINENELPEEAALREVREETGLDVELYRPDQDMAIKDARQLVRPSHLLLEDIEPGHQHIDFIFFARANTRELRPRNGETSELRWFTREDIEKWDMPDNVKKNSLEALETLNQATS